MTVDGGASVIGCPAPALSMSVSVGDYVRSLYKYVGVYRKQASDGFQMNGVGYAKQKPRRVHNNRRSRVAVVSFFVSRED